VHEPEFAPTLADIRADVPLVAWAVARATSTRPRSRQRRAGGAPRLRATLARRPVILYTGGTTGMPKGVMWRAEDIFFGALQGGNAGGAPIEQPERIADSARAGGGRTLPACPFMHAPAHWVAFLGVLRRRHRRHLTDRKLDAGRLLELIAAEQVTFLVIVGDAFARPPRGRPGGHRRVGQPGRTCRHSQGSCPAAPSCRPR